MEEYKLTLGLGITGSFCTFGKILRTTEALVQKGIKVIPVYSRHAGTLDTRFMTAEVFQNRMQEKGEFKVSCRQKPSVRQDFLM